MKIVTTAVLLIALSGFAVPQKTHDVPAEMARAQQALENAKNELASAGADWGGHRIAAIKHVDAALAEVQKAVVWAKQHKEMK